MGGFIKPRIAGPEPSCWGDLIREVVQMVRDLESQKFKISLNRLKEDFASASPCCLRPYPAPPPEVGVVLAVGLVSMPSAEVCLRGVSQGTWAKAHLVHTASFTPAQACPQGRFWRWGFSSFPIPAIVSIIILLAFCVQGLGRNGPRPDLLTGTL